LIDFSEHASDLLLALTDDVDLGIAAIQLFNHLLVLLGEDLHHSVLFFLFDVSRLVRVDLHHVQIVHFLVRVLDLLGNSEPIVKDNEQLLTHDVRLILLLHTVESGGHHGNNHVQNQKKSHESAYEETDPEDNWVLSLSEVFNQLEVTQSKAIRLDE